MANNSGSFNYHRQYNPVNTQYNPVQQYPKQRGFFSRILTKISNFGMHYDDKVFRNSFLIGLNETLPMGGDGRIGPMGNNQADVYIRFMSQVMAEVMNKKSIPYFNPAYLEKRDILRDYSTRPEIDEFIQKILDDAIVYDDNNFFCRPVELSGAEYTDEQKAKFREVFERIYYLLGFNEGREAFFRLRDYLVDGYLAYEIIYDDEMRNIIKYKQLDPAHIVPTYDPQTDSVIWIQFPDDLAQRRIVLDSQIVLISFSNVNNAYQLSYVETLIRPFNNLQTVENTRVIFNIINATMQRKIIIPVDGYAPHQAQQIVQETVANYKDDVRFDTRTGMLEINGEPNIPFHKDWILPSSEGNSPVIEMMNTEGYNLNDDIMLNYFLKALQRASKIPAGRFNNENGGGNLFGDAAEVTRDEISFRKYINHIQTPWKEILVKGIYIQMVLEFPELRNNPRFRQDIGIEFNKENLFEEWRQLNNLKKRVEVFTAMLDGVKNSKGEPALHPELLMKKILNFTDEEIAENAAYFKGDEVVTASPQEETEDSGMGMATDFGDE